MRQRLPWLSAGCSVQPICSLLGDMGGFMKLGHLSAQAAHELHLLDGAVLGGDLIPEATERLVRHAFEDLGCSALLFGYYEGNEKSRRCQEKTGFTFHHVEKDKPCELMGDVRTEYFTRLTKDEWLRRQS